MWMRANPADQQHGAQRGRGHGKPGEPYREMLAQRRERLQHLHAVAKRATVTSADMVNGGQGKGAGAYQRNQKEK